MYKLSADFTILRKVTKVSSSLSAAAIEYKKTIKISYSKDEDCETRMKENAVISDFHSILPRALFSEIA